MGRAACTRYVRRVIAHRLVAVVSLARLQRLEIEIAIRRTATLQALGQSLVVECTRTAGRGGSGGDRGRGGGRCGGRGMAGSAAEHGADGAVSYLRAGTECHTLSNSGAQRSQHGRGSLLLVCGRRRGCVVCRRGRSTGRRTSGRGSGGATSRSR